jgi:hypothetical protein
VFLLQFYIFKQKLFLLFNCLLLLLILNTYISLCVFKLFLQMEGYSLFRNLKKYVRRPTGNTHESCFATRVDFVDALVRDNFRPVLYRAALWHYNERGNLMLFSSNKVTSLRFKLPNSCKFECYTLMHRKLCKLYYTGTLKRICRLRN